MSTVLSDDDAKELIAERIREQLDRIGWTQGDLARSLRNDDKSLQNWRMRVSRWCRGENLPTAADLCNIAEVTGCGVDDLLPVRKKI